MELGPRGVAGRFCLVALPLKLREGTVELGLRPEKGNVAWLVLVSLKGPWEAEFSLLKRAFYPAVSSWLKLVLGVLEKLILIMITGTNDFGKMKCCWGHGN